MRAPFAGLAIVATLAVACMRRPIEPLRIEGNLVIVSNTSVREWTNVEIWLNHHYRVTARSVPARGRFQAPLDTFVAGFGQRFDYRRAQITALRLTGRLPDGQPFEVKKQFQKSGLAGALEGLR